MFTRLTTLARRYWPATLLVSAGAIWALYQIASGWHRRHLAEMEVARLRSLGIPTNADELTLFVARPTGFADATSVWKIPLDAIESGSIGRPPYGLKVLDERDHQPSLPGENWDQLEQAEKYLAQCATLYRQIDDATAA